MRPFLTVLIGLAWPWTGGPAQSTPAPLEVDHVWIMVSPGAPERSALERAGLRIAPTVNRHDGQGTASITVEFYNGFLELIWPDSSVPIAPGFEAAAHKFQQRMAWRTTGRAPIGVGLRRTPAAPDSLPFQSWALRPAWLRPGAAIEMLTPRSDTISPSLFLSPSYLVLTEEAKLQAARGDTAHASLFAHPLGVRRLTGVRLVTPPTYRPIESLQSLAQMHVLEVATGETWLVELTLDEGARGEVSDLRPQLPLLLRY